MCILVRSTMLDTLKIVSRSLGRNKNAFLNYLCHNVMLKIIRSTNRTDKCKIRKRITVINADWK